MTAPMTVKERARAAAQMVCAVHSPQSWIDSDDCSCEFAAMVFEREIFAALEEPAAIVADLTRRAISAESRLEWERGTHEAFVAVHHATVEKLAAERDGERERCAKVLRKMAGKRTSLTSRSLLCNAAATIEKGEP